MQGVLNFSLPDERQEFDMALHGADYCAALSELDQFLQNALEYGHKFDSADAALQAVRDQLHEELDGIPWRT